MGIEQTSSLGSENNDRTIWNDENYEMLRKTLHQFIPLIRFIGISDADLLNKVYPYKVNIPPVHTLLSPRKVIINSNIIRPKLANVIANWINRSNSYTTALSYSFNLIYRGKNGNIRSKCSGKRDILILIKVKHSEKTFGGYNPVGWVNNDWINKDEDYYDGRNYRLYRRLHDSSYSKERDDIYKSTTESFTFSFENNKDTKNMKINRVK